MTFEEKLFALANKKGLNEDNARYFEYLPVSLHGLLLAKVIA